MSAFATDESGWPNADGWPYADADPTTEEALVPGPEGGPWEAFLESDDPYDDDAVALHAFAPHLLDDLDPVEQAVIRGRFGIGGEQVRSMRALQQELGVSRDDLRRALGSGLDKIRSHLLA